jgi:glucose-6-phosphate 1-dehydrogenase
MVPNHIMQLVALAAMEPPNSFDANAVRTEQVKALQAVAPLKPEAAVRGQYGPGTAAGKAGPAYRDEQRVAKDSPVETFVAMKLVMDNWRWAGVPFYLRTGKRMAERTTEMTVQFRCPPFVLFRDTPVEQIGANRLVLQLQPNEGISLELQAKVPGPEIEMKSVGMKFAYADYFGKSTNTGYETLLFDCMIGDQTLFKTADAVEAGWAIVQPVLDEWTQKKPEHLPNYAAGTWGPECAAELMEHDGRRWRK